MVRNTSERGSRRHLWLLTAAIAVPMVVVFVLAVNAIVNAYHAELARERNHLKFLAALRARELDSLPSLVSEVLDRKKPILRLPLEPPPPLPGERPLIRRFFVLDRDNRALLPRLPYLPESSGSDAAARPYLVELSSSEAFTPPDESGAPIADAEQIDRWIEQLQEAEERLERGEKVAALDELQALGAETADCFFGHWVRYRWATTAETLQTPPAGRVDAIYSQIARASFRELIPDHPLRLHAAFRLAARRLEESGNYDAVFDYLKALYSNPAGIECSQAGFEALLARVEALLHRPGAPPLPQDLARLRADVDDRIHLVEKVLPGLPAANHAVSFSVGRMADGRKVFLAYRLGRASYFDSVFVEGGILDFGSPAAPLARPSDVEEPDEVRFAVLDRDGNLLWGHPPPGDRVLVARVKAGPADLFQVQAFHRNPDTYQGGLQQNLFFFLAFISLLAVAAGAGGFLAYRSLRYELELTRLKSEFIAGVSHELRTPLTTIQMFGEMLELGRVRDPQQARDYYSAIHAEAGRLRLLIDDLLDFGRMEAGKVVLSTATTDPVDLARAALATFSRTPEGEDRQVRFTEPETPPGEIRLDRPAVERALLNLLVNASKYSDPSTPITLTVSANPQSVTYCIEDEGIGIPRRYQRKIFEKFFRVPDSSAREIGGTGLGLALVQQIARAHGGSVSVVSAPGRGARFSLVFPRRGSEGIDKVEETRKT
jgi:signal transduction histidine kinase